MSEKEKLENLRIRIDPTLQAAFEAFVLRKKISKQDTISGVLKWFFGQDDAFQSMILGQIYPTDDLVEMLLRRLAEKQAPFTNVVSHLQDPSEVTRDRIGRRAAIEKSRGNKG